jgi:hypothetical protein
MVKLLLKYAEEIFNEKELFNFLIQENYFLHSPFWETCKAENIDAAKLLIENAKNLINSKTLSFVKKKYLMDCFFNDKVNRLLDHHATYWKMWEKIAEDVQNDIVKKKIKPRVLPVSSEIKEDFNLKESHKSLKRKASSDDSSSVYSPFLFKKRESIIEVGCSKKKTSKKRPFAHSIF